MSYKRGLAVVIGCVVAAAVSLAATWPRFHPAAPAGAIVSAGVPAKAPPGPSIVADFGPLPNRDNPLSWARLTDSQRAALAPFATEWDQFSDQRRRKWLRIASRYPKMSADAQKRLHERMTEWVLMTPEQRRVARENYQVSKDLPAQARKKAWTAYQQLSDEQKARLAASERRRRPTVVSVPPTGKSEMRDIDRLVNERERAAAQHAPGGASTPNAAASTPATGSVAPATPAPVTPILLPDSPTYKGS
ncbi:DUF3106 domain-containing protein [Paraburkholderia caballeronis]|uniref:DUF3106 domain-containing protein n=1 Tax=Paraburkholderia caballeronis TaxID=416943 RepID=UPI001064F4E9|nr:DUF3106 domain-containing protein [Paraburkholderia caballeronis]TDV12122.1 uncharacterized protein DUF3106 [Paraburkholderia caballeronis]TDV15197.1 uncharacterized protein DUF3106 [Paraburkholderia caballeronis]TDV24569.1 uncharacterized protein DUF3106 [Paraburkholderia caballeronis]TDV32750.1 uncharacterized protein DUF3106 [Paraburkholderia caballeronis]